MAWGSPVPTSTAFVPTLSSGAGQGQEGMTCKDSLQQPDPLWQGMRQRRDVCGDVAWPVASSVQGALAQHLLPALGHCGEQGLGLRAPPDFSSCTFLAVAALL